jgi:hypothetical protein
VVFGLQNAPSAAIFTPILLIATTVGTIFNNVDALTNPTTVSNYFLYHVFKFSHHLLFDHYQKKNMLTAAMTSGG